MAGFLDDPGLVIMQPCEPRLTIKIFEANYDVRFLFGKPSSSWS
jgi:hypothetical protein